MELASRNDSFGFAERCKKNLLHIEKAYPREDVHLVTQIINSSLGLIVFPWEKRVDLKIRGKRLNALDKSRWPQWAETKPSKGLGELIHNLRNAIAHANIQFSSDDREPSKVTITFESENGDWQATISALDLRTFCLRFIELVEEETG